eukprot:300156-Rhodomonas_salina.1
MGLHTRGKRYDAGPGSTLRNTAASCAASVFRYVQLSRGFEGGVASSGQSSQLLLPTKNSLPALSVSIWTGVGMVPQSQYLQLACPAVRVYDPIHSSHTCWPVLLCAEPAGHGVHLSICTSRTVPAGHGTQPSLAAFATLPGAHWKQ